MDDVGGGWETVRGERWDAIAAVLGACSGGKLCRCRRYVGCRR